MKTHWIADYCMSRLETDDEIAAGPCISKELARKFRSQCAAKLHYKKALCGLAFSRKQLKTDAARCVRDKDFVGRTVRNGGVGGN
jgi:hypothetical protein